MSIRRDTLAGAVPEVVVDIMTVSLMSLPWYCKVGTHVMSYRLDRVCRQFRLCQGVVFRSQLMMCGSLYCYCRGRFTGVGADVVSLSDPRERDYLFLYFIPFWRNALGSF